VNRIGREPYGRTQVHELIVADQKQPRVSFGLSISVVNAAAMRPTAAILKERGTIYVVPPAKSATSSLTISFQRRRSCDQAAAHCVTEAAENNGPTMFARIGVMRALNRYHVREFNPKEQ